MTRPIEATPEDIARFMSFVDKLPCGCWFWTGARSRGKGNRKWYGSFALSTKGGKKKHIVRAHRFACEVIANPPKLCPPGYHRDHECVFSLCVNPACITIRTHGENEELKKQRRAA